MNKRNVSNSEDTTFWVDQNSIKKVELLAPAGNPEGFYGAIQAGADAVYLGGDRFGARAYAENFTTEELIACIRYAHIRGRKVYLTINTLVKESEMDQIVPYLLPFYEAGLDGVIVQDIGVFCLIRDSFPGLELHVSTQMTLTGKYGAELLKQMGACRIVPARELSLDEIKKLKAETGLEIECFIHGAMCYCYSGQCLFSSILGGRSGNRGKCAQPCRLPYRVEIDGKISEECYPLSLKDMCTIEHIPDLIRAGIDSFKIEGRMKKAEYAAGVTAIYRKYIDRFYAGESCTVSAKDLKQLSELYIRSERQDGYYYRHNGADMITLHNPSYRNADEKLISDIRYKYLESARRIPVSVRAEFRIGEPARLIWLSGDGQSVTQTVVTGEVVAPALKQPITEDNIRNQLGKLGDTSFVPEKIDVVLDPGCFYPLKALNELRREAVRQMEDSLIDMHGLSCGRRAMPEIVPQMSCQNNVPVEAKTDNDSSLHVLVHTEEQLLGVLDVMGRGEGLFSVDRIYLEGNLACKIQEEKDLLQYIEENCQCELMIALPQILRRCDEDFLKQLKKMALTMDRIRGFLVRSMDGMGYLKEWLPSVEKELRIYTDAGFYVWNQNSLKAIKADGFCLPYELKAADQRKLISDCAGQQYAEKPVYGYIPLMHTANCVFRTLRGCRKESDDRPAYLTDRYRKRFPVVKNCTHCMNIIYNCLPLSLHGELKKWLQTVDFRVDFSIEDKVQTMQVLQYFMTGCQGERPYEEYTSGHEKRGAE